MLARITIALIQFNSLCIVWKMNDCRRKGGKEEEREGGMKWKYIETEELVQ